jgi:hypothetical protein
MGSMPWREAAERKALESAAYGVGDLARRFETVEVGTLKANMLQTIRRAGRRIAWVV